MLLNIISVNDDEVGALLIFLSDGIHNSTSQFLTPRNGLLDVLSNNNNSNNVDIKLSL